MTQSDQIQLLGLKGQTVPVIDAPSFVNQGPSSLASKGPAHKPMDMRNG